MAGIRTNYMDGVPGGPKHEVAPKPFEAVAGEPAVRGGNLLTNRMVGTPDPEQIVVMIGDRNLVDIIAELQTLLP